MSDPEARDDSCVDSSDAVGDRLAGRLSRFREVVEPLLPDDPREARAWRQEGMRSLSDDDAAALAVGLLVAMTHARASDSLELLPTLCRRRLPLDCVDVAAMFDVAGHVEGWRQVPALSAVVSCAERLAPQERSLLVPRLRSAIDELDAAGGQPTKRAAVRARLARLIPAAVDVPTIGSLNHAIRPNDCWGMWATDRLARTAARDARVGELLVFLAQPLRTVTPPAGWLERARQLLDALPDSAELVYELLLGAIGCPRGEDDDWRVADDNGDVVRGLVWAAVVLDRQWLVAVVSGIIQTDRPSRLPVDRKLLNAAIAALGQAGTSEAVRVLRDLRAGIGDAGYRKQIDRALRSSPQLRSLNPDHPSRSRRT